MKTSHCEELVMDQLIKARHWFINDHPLFDLPPDHIIWSLYDQSLNDPTSSAEKQNKNDDTDVVVFENQDVDSKEEPLFSHLRWRRFIKLVINNFGADYNNNLFPNFGEITHVKTIFGYSEQQPENQEWIFLSYAEELLNIPIGSTFLKPDVIKKILESMTSKSFLESQKNETENISNQGPKGNNDLNIEQIIDQMRHITLKSLETDNGAQTSAIGEKMFSGIPLELRRGIMPPHLDGLGENTSTPTRIASEMFETASKLNKTLNTIVLNVTAREPPLSTNSLEIEFQQDIKLYNINQACFLIAELSKYFPVRDRVYTRLVYTHTLQQQQQQQQQKDNKSPTHIGAKLRETKIHADSFTSLEDSEKSRDDFFAKFSKLFASNPDAFKKAQNSQKVNRERGNDASNIEYDMKKLIFSDSIDDSSRVNVSSETILSDLAMQKRGAPNGKNMTLMGDGKYVVRRDIFTNDSIVSFICEYDKKRHKTSRRLEVEAENITKIYAAMQQFLMINIFLNKVPLMASIPVQKRICSVPNATDLNLKSLDQENPFYPYRGLDYWMMTPKLNGVNIFLFINSDMKLYFSFAKARNRAFLLGTVDIKTPPRGKENNSSGSSYINSSMFPIAFEGEMVLRWTIDDSQNYDRIIFHCFQGRPYGPQDIKAPDEKFLQDMDNAWGDFSQAYKKNIDIRLFDLSTFQLTNETWSNAPSEYYRRSKLVERLCHMKNILNEVDISPHRSSVENITVNVKDFVPATIQNAKDLHAICSKTPLMYDGFMIQNNDIISETIVYKIKPGDKRTIDAIPIEWDRNWLPLKTNHVLEIISQFQERRDQSCRTDDAGIVALIQSQLTTLRNMALSTWVCEIDAHFTNGGHYEMIRYDKIMGNSPEVLAKLTRLNPETFVSPEFLINKESRYDIIGRYSNYLKYKVLTAIAEAAPPGGKTSIVDIGSGQGGDLQKWLHLKFSRVIAIDHSAEMIREFKSRLSIMQKRKKARLATNGNYSLPAITLFNSQFNADFINNTLNPETDPSVFLQFFSYHTIFRSKPDLERLLTSLQSYWRQHRQQNEGGGSTVAYPPSWWIVYINIQSLHKSGMFNIEDISPPNDQQQSSETAGKETSKAQSSTFEQWPRLYKVSLGNTYVQNSIEYGFNIRTFSQMCAKVNFSVTEKFKMSTGSVNNTLLSDHEKLWIDAIKCIRVTPGNSFIEPHETNEDSEPPPESFFDVTTDLSQGQEGDVAEDDEESSFEELFSHIEFQDESSRISEDNVEEKIKSVIEAAQNRDELVVQPGSELLIGGNNEAVNPEYIKLTKGLKDLTFLDLPTRGGENSKEGLPSTVQDNASPSFELSLDSIQSSKDLLKFRRATRHTSVDITLPPLSCNFIKFLLDRCDSEETEGRNEDINNDEQKVNTLRTNLDSAYLFSIPTQESLISGPIASQQNIQSFLSYDFSIPSLVAKSSITRRCSECIAVSNMIAFVEKNFTFNNEENDNSNTNSNGETLQYQRVIFPSKDYLWAISSCPMTNNLTPRLIYLGGIIPSLSDQPHLRQQTLAVVDPCLLLSEAKPSFLVDCGHIFMILTERSTQDIKACHALLTEKCGFNPSRIMFYPPMKTTVLWYYASFIDPQRILYTASSDTEVEVNSEARLAEHLSGPVYQSNCNLTFRSALFPLGADFIKEYNYISDQIKFDTIDSQYASFALSVLPFINLPMYLIYNYASNLDRTKDYISPLNSSSSSSPSGVFSNEQLQLDQSEKSRSELNIYSLSITGLKGEGLNITPVQVFASLFSPLVQKFKEHEIRKTVLKWYPKGFSILEGGNYGSLLLPLKLRESLFFPDNISVKTLYIPDMLPHAEENASGNAANLPKDKPLAMDFKSILGSFLSGIIFDKSLSTASTQLFAGLEFISSDVLPFKGGTKSPVIVSVYERFDYWLISLHDINTMELLKRVTVKTFTKSAFIKMIASALSRYPITIYSYKDNIFEI